MAFRSLIALSTLVLLATACGGSRTESDPPEPARPVAGVRVLDRNTGLPPALRLPPAARQLQEGYWLGAMIGPEHVAALRVLGIRVVLSAVRPTDATMRALEEAGIARIDVPMGATFAHDDTILGVVDHYPAETIFIHCRHGADRTGAIAAFILSVRHGWALADALYSVIYASQPDLAGLAELLRDAGVEDARPIDDPSVGFYSVRAAGGVGGLKARNDRYSRLVATTIEAIRAQGE